MRYLLDTNILSSLVRSPSGIVAARIKAIGAERVYTSIVVAAELRFGVARKGSDRLSRQVDAILGAMEIAPWQAPFDLTYAAIRLELEAAGTPIGADDLLIAAQAMAQDSVLVTDNTNEFRRIVGLTVENWLRP